MRSSKSIIVLLLLVGSLGTGWLLFLAATPELSGVDQHAGPSEAAKSGLAKSTTSTSDRIVVEQARQPNNWRALATRWLFDADARGAGRLLHAGVANGTLSSDVAGRILFDLLQADVSISHARLCRATPVAAFLRLNERPSADVAVRAYAYVGTLAQQDHHRSLQAQLAAWPCFDTASCQASLAAALSGLDAESVWALLRDRLTRDGSAAIDRIVEASLKLAQADKPRVARLSLIMEALFSFAGDREVQKALHAGMTLLGEAILVDAANREAVSRFGVWAPSMNAWGAALRAFLGREPSRPDSLSSSARHQLVVALLGTPWPSDLAEANAFHRLMLGLADGRTSPQAIGYLRRLALHAPLPGVRITALSKLGATQPVEALERAFAEIVAADAASIHDEQLRVGFYAAVDNARILNPSNREGAIRLFRECLAESSPGAIPYQLFVLKAIERSPLTELAWAVEQIAHRPGSSQLADQAARTLLILSR